MIEGPLVANLEQSLGVSSSAGLPRTVSQLADINLRSALIAYLTTGSLAGEIARRHGFSASTLSYWARKFDLPLRRRGRRPLSGPTRQHRRVLDLVRMHGMAAAARRIGRSRQLVHQIVIRWAPELRSVHKVSAKPYRSKPDRLEPRKAIVCFRMTQDELKILASLDIPKAPRAISSNEKAREVILRFLARTCVRAGRRGGRLSPPVTCKIKSTNCD